LHNAKTTHNTWPIVQGFHLDLIRSMIQFPSIQNFEHRHDNKLCLKLPPDPLQFMGLGFVP